MRSTLVYFFLFLASMANCTQAEVLAAGANGFKLKVVTTSSASPEHAYLAFTQIEKWWDPDHTYSGDAANLTLTIQPGGAFVEALPGVGFVTHMELVYALPGQEIRLLGGLGPLQAMGLHGALTIQFKPHAKGSEITMLYNVSGFSEQGLQDLAPIVDRVQAGQMQRHAAYADSM
jgi:hypothetical protein